MLGHRHGKGEDRMKKCEAKREAKSAYKQMTEELPFEAKMTAMLARQASGIEDYAVYEGLPKADLKVKFQRQALSLAMKAAFICRKSGIDESTIHKAVELATAKAIKNKLNGA